MKPLSFYFVFVCSMAAVIGMAGCVKERRVYVDAPYACFTVQVMDAYGFPTNVNANYTDSVFYFRNCSDSGGRISFQWDFGDGNTSKESNPRHSYSRRGKYKVTLLVSNDGKADDTLSQVVTVKLGEQLLSQGQTMLSAVAAVENADNGFAVLVSKDYTISTQYLYTLDSLLKQRSVKELPGGYRFTAMTGAGDGNYVLTGTTTGSDKLNQLVKLSPSGSVIWARPSTYADDYCYTVSATPDGGYGVVASKPVPVGNGNNNYNALIKKMDGNGNLQWEKLLDQEGMIQTTDAVFEQDGVVVAGVKRNVSNTCSDCDSVLIVKLNNSGQVVWKNTVFWGFNSSVWWGTRTVKLGNGNYAVANENLQGIFYFSPAGQFLDRRLVQSSTSKMAASADGKLIILQNEFGNGFRMTVSKYDLNGAWIWTARPDGRQRTPGGFSCCADSRPNDLVKLKKGGYLVVGSILRSSNTGYNNYSEILLYQLDEEGATR